MSTFTRWMSAGFSLNGRCLLALFALIPLFLLNIHPAQAQRPPPCDTSCSIGAPRYLNGCCRPASVAKRAPAAACPAGQERNVDTAGQCCWPGQAWSRTRDRCVGTPECPAGAVLRGDACVVERARPTIVGPAAAAAPIDIPWRNIPAGQDFPAFQLSRSEVTVAWYRACVEAGACTPAGTDSGCNAALGGRDDHPINCVDHTQAQSFARWIGGRLPTDAEWGWAAGSAKGWTYPWGEAAPSCRFAVMDENEGFACGRGDTTLPTCSRRDGNSVQGLCDLSGNVREWTADRAADGVGRVVRGGGFSNGAGTQRAAQRGQYGPQVRYVFLGFRVARDAQR